MPDADKIDLVLEKLAAFEAALKEKITAYQISEEKTVWANTYYKVITELLITDQELIFRGAAGIDVPQVAEKLANAAVDSFRKRFGES